MPGSWGYTSGIARSSSSSVANTYDDLLYQRYRELTGEYKFTVPDGNYQVLLKFAEFVSATITGRTMEITLESTEVESSLCIYCAAGRAVAYDRTYTVTVNDGILNITFAKVGAAAYNPMISAIEVRKVP